MCKGNREATAMKKVAIIMMNFGGPDSLNSVKPFLFNLFYDKRIIRLPALFRFFIAKLISLFRFKKSKAIYAKMGGASPIFKETLEQSRKLEAELLKSDQNEGVVYKSFVCMRYWHPSARDMMHDVEEYSPDVVILLPMYPHFSTTTILSSMDDWYKFLSPRLSDVPHIVVPNHHMNYGFIDSHAHLICSELRKSEIVSSFDMQRKVCILFSAHSLPQSIIDDGDPYQRHLISSVEAIMTRVKELTGRDYEHFLSYQSKVGRMKWLEPSSEEEIAKLSSQGFGLIVVPISFVAENSETLVELDIDYADIAKKAPFYLRVPTLGTNSFYIKCLQGIVSDIVKRL